MNTLAVLQNGRTVCNSIVPLWEFTQFIWWMPSEHHLAATNPQTKPDWHLSWSASWQYLETSPPDCPRGKWLDQICSDNNLPADLSVKLILGWCSGPALTTLWRWWQLGLWVHLYAATIAKQSAYVTDHVVPRLSVRMYVLWRSGWLDPHAVWGGEWCRARKGCIRFWWWSSKGKEQFGGWICGIPL